MTSRIDQERVQLLLKRVGLNDRAVGAKIGAHQTTIWRLRNRKIQKLDKYIAALETLCGAAVAPKDGFDVERLAALANESPALRALLVSLTEFMQEDATTLRADVK